MSDKKISVPLDDKSSLSFDIEKATLSSGGQKVSASLDDIGSVIEMTGALIKGSVWLVCGVAKLAYKGGELAYKGIEKIKDKK